MAERAHLSIGEVLSLLREEFPDITISKIRFLESQGLLDPERTPSGYRKFYEEDVERLQWILRQQREHFLPLKVIKGRLTGESTGTADEEAPLAAGDEAAAEAGAANAATKAATKATTKTAAAERSAPRSSAARPPLPAGTNLTVEELGAACGLTDNQIRDLQRFGLLSSRDVGGTAYFDEAALSVARLAGSFARHGVEARHLRMYKNAAERESGLFEQIVMPLIKQRNPQARQQAMATLEELSALGGELRQTLLRQSLRDAF
ncbi:MAG TPA: MerR family transcriptional regulator [Acidimicrobiales bacterium]|nr:MerR family transcriptional regulator [Acidimicrobiales bacterium]